MGGNGDTLDKTIEANKEIITNGKFINKCDRARNTYHMQ